MRKIHETRKNVVNNTLLIHLITQVDSPLRKPYTHVFSSNNHYHMNSSSKRVLYGLLHISTFCIPRVSSSSFPSSSIQKLISPVNTVIQQFLFPDFERVTPLLMEGKLMVPLREKKLFAHTKKYLETREPGEDSSYERKLLQVSVGSLRKPIS